MSVNFGRLGMTDFEKREVRDELRKGFGTFMRGGARIAQAMTPSERSARSKKGAASRKFKRTALRSNVPIPKGSKWAEYHGSGPKRERSRVTREGAMRRDGVVAFVKPGKVKAKPGARLPGNMPRAKLMSLSPDQLKAYGKRTFNDADIDNFLGGKNVKKSDQPGGGDVHVDGPMPDFPKKTKKKQANPASMDVEKGNGLGVPVQPPRPKKALSGPRLGAKRVEEDEVPTKSPGGAGLSDYKGDGSGSASYKDGSSFDGRGWQPDKGSGPRSPRKQGQLGYVKN